MSEAGSMSLIQLWISRVLCSHDNKD